MVALVGQDLSDGSVCWGADLVEPGAIRRYLEPLEFDCPLHYDRETARRHGFDDVTAPYTSIGTFSLPAQWRPGEPLFVDAGRNAQPAYSPLRGTRVAVAPPTTGFFATEYGAEYLRAPVVGDRLGRRGNRLLRCDPKATRVGRGAFTLWEYEVVNQRLDVVARCRLGFFFYNPLPATSA
ncbi:hypothetical protein RD110_26260 [Rhodoferax koreense]|uniref:FAS1-like dehydratase domain-containing protein n=2 Tax=Rhodoferax koreensis TaxID=1842727 RepID=A0A1P8K4P5_9BURK|nr:hypothetical protein RD110_26260 [Rhodoferax koreense]